MNLIKILRILDAARFVLNLFRKPKPPVLIVALLLSLVSLSSCAGMGGAVGHQVVAYASVNGTGDVRSDGNVTVAMGELDGDVGLAMKGSGFPLHQPFKVEKGKVFIKNSELHLEFTQELSDPLPAWCAPLYRPGESESLGHKLGVEIEFSPPDA